MNRTLKDLSAAVESRHEEIVDFLMELIAIATPNPPGENYERIASALHGRFEEAGMQMESIHVPVEALAPHGIDGERYPRPALLGRWGAGSGKSLHIHGHFDVVPANNPAQYKPARRKGRVYGRGAADMKSGLVAVWAALRALRECGLEPARPVTLSITPDEESGGETGAAYLIREGIIRTEDMAFLIMPECTSGNIWNASKGALVVDVIVKGKPAHSTLPHLGRNAFEDMMSVADALVALRKQVETRRSRFVVEDPRAAYSTMAIGGEGGGGEKFNIVPGRYHFTVDRRPIPEEKLDDVRAELFAVEAEMRDRGIDVTFETWLEAHPSFTEPDDPGVQALSHALHKVTGRVPRALLCPGFVDIRHFNARGVSAVACGPGQLEVAHGPGEWVAENDLLDYAKALALTIAG